MSSTGAAVRRTTQFKLREKARECRDMARPTRFFKSEVQPLEGLPMEKATLKTPGVAQESQDCDTENLSHHHTSFSIATMGWNVELHDFDQAQGHMLCWIAPNHCVFESFLSAMPQRQGEASQPDSWAGKRLSGWFSSLDQGDV